MSALYIVACLLYADTGCSTIRIATIPTALCDKAAQVEVAAWKRERTHVTIKRFFCRPLTAGEDA